MNLELDRSLQKRLAPLHLIGACLIAGVIVFAGVALTVGPVGSSAAPAGGGAGTSAGAMTMPALMRMVWGVLAITQIPLAFILRGMLVNRAVVFRRNEPARSAIAGSDGVHGPTFEHFRNATIIGLALVESLALLGCITLLMSADPIDLLLVGVPVVVMLALFPTSGRWRGFDAAVQTRAAVER